MNNKIYFSKVKENAIIPTKRREDAGYDIYACFDEDYIIVDKDTTVMIPTGIASALPNDKYIHIEERGSTGSIGMKKSAGIIDSGYRGEWFIAITNCNDKPIVISKLPQQQLFVESLQEEFIYYPYTKAIAQAIVAPVLNLVSETIPYETLKQIESERGVGALGSSEK